MNDLPIIQGATSAPWSEATAPLILSGDKRVLLNGQPPKVAIRILCEENYQLALRCVNALAKYK